MLPAFAQSKKKQRLFTALTSIDNYFVKIEKSSDSIKSLTNRAFHYREIVKNLYSGIGALDTLYEKSDSICFCYFFRPKLGTQLSITKSALESLKSTLVLQETFYNTIPEGTVLHLDSSKIADSLKEEFKRLLPQQLPDSLGGGSRKVPFDTWVNDVYKYNIKTALEDATFLPVLIEYMRFKNAYLKFKSELPSRWKNKLH